MNNELNDLAERLINLRAEKDDLANQAKLNNDKIKDTMAQMQEIMMQEDNPSFVHGNKMFSLKSTKYWSIADDESKNELYKKLKARGFKDLFTVNSQTLKGFLKTTIESYQVENETEKVPKWLNGLVKNYEDISISITKK